MSKDSPEKVLSRWDWPEYKADCTPTVQGELLPPIVQSPAPAKAPTPSLKTLVGHPLERRRAGRLTMLQTALERLQDAILYHKAVYAEALTLASVWRAWLEPFGLPLPILPVLPVEHPALLTNMGWLQYQALEARLGELKGHLNLLAHSRTKDATAVFEACQRAADAFLTLLQVFHLAPSEARAAEADELGLSTPTEGANSAPEIPLKRQVELSWRALAGAFAILESMRGESSSHLAIEWAHKVATVWRKWVEPLEELELPALPMRRAEVPHANIEESRAFSEVWERLLDAKHCLDYVAYHRLHDNKTVVEELKMKFKLAAEAWLHWLGRVGMAPRESGAGVELPTGAPEWGAALPRVTLPSLEGAELVAAKFAQLELARQEGIGDDVSDCAHEVAAALNQWASEGSALPRFCVPKALGGWDLLPWFHTPGQERDVEDNLFWVAFEGMRNAESAVRVALEHDGVNPLNVLRVKQSFVRAASAWLNWLSCMNLVPEAEAEQEVTRLQGVVQSSQGSPSRAPLPLSPRALGVQQGIDPLDGSADIAADMLERHMPGSTHQERLEAVFSARTVSLTGWTPPAPRARVSSPKDEKSGWEMVEAQLEAASDPSYLTALRVREQRLWGQLMAWGWLGKFKLRRYIKARQEYAAFEKAQARIMREQGNPAGAEECLSLAEKALQRGSLRQAEFDIRLSLLHHWATTVRELHGWTGDSKPPTPRGPVGAQVPGPLGQGVEWIDTDLRFGAANVPSAFVDEDSDAWNLQSELAEGQDEHTPAAVVYELDGDDPADHFSPTRLASLLRANGLEPFDSLLESVEGELEDADLSPLEDSEVSPLQDVPTELHSLVAATAPLGTGLRQARALMQWFSPVLLVILLVGCAHEPQQQPPHMSAPVHAPSDEYPPNCAQLMAECSPQYLDPTVNNRVLKYCRSRGYRLEQCLW